MVWCVFPAYDRPLEAIAGLIRAESETKHARHKTAGTPWELSPSHRIAAHQGTGNGRQAASKNR